jgi:DNA polymerase I-like protein with 3'-5' exonuclease and polymerase domains
MSCPIVTLATSADPDQEPPRIGQKSQVTFDKVAIDDAVKYAAEDADITLRLWQHFKPQLAPGDRVTTVYETLERPLVTGPGRDGDDRHPGRPRHAAR